MAINSTFYRRVAELHIANINLGFLSTLGLGFVALMYEAIDQGKGSVLLVSEVNGRVVGFVAGATGMGSIYRRMLRSWPRLFITLLPSLFSPGRVWRILEILRYSSGPTMLDNLPTAELISIAVDPAFRGMGHAERLYQGLADHYQSEGLLAFKIVVGSALAPAHRFYRRMGAEPVADLEVHSGENSIVYVHKLRTPNGHV